MKLTSLTLFLLGAFLSQNALSGEFKFNNKNLNALMALVCHSSQASTTSGNIYVHKLLVDKSKHGQGQNEISYELSGTCGIEYNPHTKQVISMGEEFTVEFDLKNLNKIVGKIGIKDILFNFKGHNITQMTLRDPLMMSEKSFKLSTSSWAGSDSIFNFNQQDTFKLNLGRTTAAVEENASLKFNQKLKTSFYNTWSYESYGCSSADISLDETTCAETLKKIN